MSGVAIEMLWGQRTADELRKLTRRGAVTVVDVRPPEEYAAGHLPGALNLPLPQLAKQLHKLPANREIVAYCRGPYRSEEHTSDSSHTVISYAVFCLKKKNNLQII